MSIRLMPENLKLGFDLVILLLYQIVKSIEKRMFTLS